MSMRNVKTPVANPIALFPHMEIANVVVRADALRFTILFPTRIVVSKRSGLEARAAVILLHFDRSLDSIFIWRNDNEVKAVSAELKKADKSKRATIEET